MAAAKALILRLSQARVTSMRILFLAVTIILLGGCAVMGEQDCLNANWHAVGHQDGSVGQGRGRLQQRRQACEQHGVTVDRNAYHEGYELGLNAFCTAASGYERGREGHRYNGVCPPLLEGDFLTGYQRGREEFQLQAYIAEQDRRLYEHAQHINRLNHELNYSLHQLRRTDLDHATRARLSRHAQLLQRRLRLLHMEHREQEWRRSHMERQYRQLQRQHQQLPLWNY